MYNTRPNGQCMDSLPPSWTQAQAPRRGATATHSASRHLGRGCARAYLDRSKHPTRHLSPPSNTIHSSNTSTLGRKTVEPPFILDRSALADYTLPIRRIDGGPSTYPASPLSRSTLESCVGGCVARTRTEKPLLTQYQK